MRFERGREVKTWEERGIGSVLKPSSGFRVQGLGFRV
jgi:hypothetical protein